MGSFNKIIPARLTSSTPPSRIAGTATDNGAFAPKVAYSPNVTPLNEIPTPIAARKPDIWKNSGIPRVFSNKTQVKPIVNVQHPYRSTARLFESLPDANLTKKSAEANANEVNNAY